jgi:hypothetical protein
MTKHYDNIVILKGCLFRSHNNGKGMGYNISIIIRGRKMPEGERMRRI